MIRGLYTAASGMLAQQAVQETLAANIANANTVGYKQDTATFRSVSGAALSRVTGSGRGPGIGALGMGVTNNKLATDWKTGPIATTGAPLDASLADGQFFAISTPQGERYTRAGNFQLDGAGNLLTACGQPVLGANNLPIRITARGGSPSLDAVGNVVVAGKAVAKLKIVQADTSLLAKEGSSLFSASGGVKPAKTPSVRPGTLEQSNGNTVMDLVQLINVSRGFEMAQRAVVTQDEVIKHASTEVGKL